MELPPSTVCHYLEHAYEGMRRVLARLDDDTVNVRPPGWGTNSVAGLVVHCCELAPSWFETPGLGRETVRDRDAEFGATATVAELLAASTAPSSAAARWRTSSTPGPPPSSTSTAASCPGVTTATPPWCSTSWRSCSSTSATWRSPPTHSGGDDRTVPSRPCPS